MAFTKHQKIPLMVLSVVTFSALLAIFIPKAAGLESLTRLLQHHGLPPGIFPKNVNSFTMNHNGQLTIKLESPCYASYENVVHFNKLVTANLTYGELVGLEGLQQMELFLWLPVKKIQVIEPDSGIIIIDIGIARQVTSISTFEEPLVCTPFPYRKNVDHEGAVEAM